MEIDTSDTSVGFVLLLHNKPLAYFSKKLAAPETMYIVHNRIFLHIFGLYKGEILLAWGLYDYFHRP